ncbi:MAG: response regulator [Candidatus Eremiobacteraeota bacterium]|nr:response regulator [Candidatus Eremiobacteraeota bacterium]
MEKKSQKILVVDDEPYIQRSLRLILEMEGFNVLTASDPLEAIQVLSQTLPDLILLDIMMPYMDGYEFAQKIKENPEYENIYIIALTARGQEKDKLKSAQIGINEHITKPFHPSHLVNRIKEILSI